MVKLMLIGAILMQVYTAYSCSTLLVNDSQGIIGIAVYDLGGYISLQEFFEQAKNSQYSGVSLLFPSESAVVETSQGSFYVYMADPNDPSFVKIFEVLCANATHGQANMNFSDLATRAFDVQRFAVKEFCGL